MLNQKIHFFNNEDPASTSKYLQDFEFFGNNFHNLLSNLSNHNKTTQYFNSEKYGQISMYIDAPPICLLNYMKFLV